MFLALIRPIFLRWGLHTCTAVVSTLALARLSCFLLGCDIFLLCWWTNQAAAWLICLTANRSQLVPHKLTTTHQFFYPCTFLGGEAESSPTGSSRRVKNTPWFQDYVHEDTK